MQLASLKEQLMYGSDFQKTVLYFQDHLGDDDVFLSNKVSHRAKNEKMDILLVKALEDFFKKERLKISNTIVLRARGTPFYHGVIHVEDHLCTFIYFDDVSMGILALVRQGVPGSHFIRLTAQMLGSGSLWN